MANYKRLILYKPSKEPVNTSSMVSGSALSTKNVTVRKRFLPLPLKVLVTPKLEHSRDVPGI